jgi:ABC-type tungstate transport system permease subunit
MRRLDLLIALAAVAISAPVRAADHREPVLLATTTSTQDTGLLDVLVPAFEKKTGLTVMRWNPSFGPFSGPRPLRPGTAC